MNPRTRRFDTRHAGFSLVEVLIALIVMSVGMLGIAGVYVHGMQAGRTSLFRHHAIALAGDVADRIRANPLAGASYTDTGPVTSAPNSLCLTALCTAEEIAASDIWSWDRQARDTLPDGDVLVSYAAPAGSGSPALYTVTITWSEAGETPSYAIEFPVFEPAL
ncbi:MAG TPA: type IV pilus modification protein PilV [Woeseiaceae bacterium]|nr:type IV pilus modification protein PilV [Woeseiaceae bacterium]